MSDKRRNVPKARANESLGVFKPSLDHDHELIGNGGLTLIKCNKEDKSSSLLTIGVPDNTHRLRPDML
jgi:hypothetical protein